MEKKTQRKNKDRRVEMSVEGLKEANTLARKILRLTVRVGGETRKA